MRGGHRVHSFGQIGEGLRNEGEQSLFLASEVQEELLALWSEVRFTLLFVTHSIEEALVVGNRIALLSPHPGRMRAEINSHGFTLESQGGTEFQAAAQRIHRLLFEEPLAEGVAA